MSIPLQHLMSGAFATLLCLPSLAEAQTVRLTVKSDLDTPSLSETIALPWQELQRVGLKPGLIQVKDPATDKPIPCQEIDLDADGKPDELVFQSDFTAGETKVFTLFPAKAAASAPKVFGRLVPERKDDFAWENERIAFRIYGRRLEDELVSSGVDVWCKRTRSLIIDRWYKAGDYHHDHGEGLDCYTVGPARGCGGTAILNNGKLCASRNFTKSRVIASGPIRFIFELSYEPWNAGGISVAETKRITLDAGQNLNRFECVFVAEGSAELPVAIGLQEHGQAQTEIHAEDGWMRVWEPTDEKTAVKLGVGFVAGPGLRPEMKRALGHALALVHASNGKPVVFFAGAGWEKGGDFPTVASWDAYLSQFAKRVRSPMRVSLLKE